MKQSGATAVLQLQYGSRVMPPLTSVAPCLALALLSLLSTSCALQTNFCPRYDEVRLGTQNISTALRGHNITAGVNTNTAKFLMTYDSTGQPTHGLVYDILSEISRRGEFDIIYQVVKTPKGLSLTQQLQYALPKVDIMVSKYYIDSPSRRSAGIGFSYVSQCPSSFTLPPPPTHTLIIHTRLRALSMLQLF
jgi:hypothetical protein